MPASSRTEPAMANAARLAPVKASWEGPAGVAG